MTIVKTRRDDDDARIACIQKAVSNEELQKATKGYLEHAIAAHPALKKNEGFNASMNADQFFRALEHVRSARVPDDDKYFDVIRMLEFAATRELAIKMF